jgi:hypothetical protein
MARAGLRKAGWVLGALVWACVLAPAQQVGDAAAPLNESGQVVVAGRATPYLIRRLPVSSFPGLPDELVGLLNVRGCLIPQTYEAHGPENVVHGSLERAGSSDWAVLCAARGTVSLLVFFGSTPKELRVLGAARETERLQERDGTGVLGFNWGIDPASPERVREVQRSMERRPARLDHDALADSVIEHRTVYRFYQKSGWTVLEVPDF